mmetsp:Transcript_71945/g.224329  ORF Transcript_71945/g.224329 Transcript_71945/m.224329 type:complete len:295 (+) Transcript_71945:427-1311(+)
MADSDVLAELHLGQTLRNSDDGLQLPDGDGDGGLVLLHGLANGNVVVLQDLGGLRGEARAAAPLAVLDVLAELQDRERALALLHDLPLVQIAHVLCKIVVALRVTHVTDKEHHVEPRQDGRLEVHLVGGVAEVVVGPKARVRSGQHRAPRVQHRGDASLRDGDGLLLHGFVDGHPVLDIHLVELVNTDDAGVSKHHGATLQRETILVRDDGRSQTSSTGTLAAGVYRDGGGLLGKLQELALGRSWVAEQQHVDVTAHARAVRHLLAGPSKEQASNRLLHVLNDVLGARADRGRD